MVEPEPGDIRCVLRATDLRTHLESDELQAASETPPDDPSAGAVGSIEVNLMDIPGQRLDVANLDYRATLAEAQAVLKARRAEALCIRRTTAPMIETVLGIVTQQDIDNYRDPGD